MTPQFTWHIDSYVVTFARDCEGVFRPQDSELRARAWQLPENSGWRASISNGRLVKVSHAHSEPQAALRECSAWFKGLVTR